MDTKFIQDRWTGTNYRKPCSEYRLAHPYLLPHHKVSVGSVKMRPWLLIDLSFTSELSATFPYKANSCSPSFLLCLSFLPSLCLTHSVSHLLPPSLSTPSSAVTEKLCDPLKKKSDRAEMERAAERRKKNRERRVLVVQPGVSAVN